MAMTFRTRHFILSFVLLAGICGILTRVVLKQRRLALANQAPLAEEVAQNKRIETLNNLGSDLGERAAQASGEEQIRLFTESVSAFRDALSGLDQQRHPANWGMTQANLAASLHSLGLLLNGLESRRALTQAREAYRVAIDILKEHPESPTPLEHIQRQYALCQERLRARTPQAPPEDQAAEESVALSPPANEVPTE